MGRTRDSKTVTFPTKAKAEEWIKKRKKKNKAAWEKHTERYDYQEHDGYISFHVQKVTKISGKPRKECIEELEKMAEKATYGADSYMVIYYAEIDPMEQSDGVKADLEAYAADAGKAFAKAAKKRKHSSVKREGKGFYKCSNCNSKLAAEHMTRNVGNCPICQFKGSSEYRDISPTKMLEDFREAVYTGYDSVTEPVKDRWGSTTRYTSMESKPLFHPGYEKEIAKAREAVKIFNARERELRRYPERANRKRPQKKAKAGPSIPINKPKNGYQLFKADKRDKVKEQFDLKKLGPVNKKLAELWKALSEEQKKPYFDQAAAGKIRYQKAVEDWKKHNPSEARKIEEAQKKRKKELAEKKKNWVACMAAISAHH
jgi:DNA-directed RNA polymerase subunit RPC12/RpoP